jgi:hypothetical protein
MRVIAAAITGWVAFAAVSVQAAPIQPEELAQLGATLSFNLGDRACGCGWHQSLRRDWLGDWWWGPFPSWH